MNKPKIILILSMLSLFCSAPFSMEPEEAEQEQAKIWQPCDSLVHEEILRVTKIISDLNEELAVQHSDEKQLELESRRAALSGLHSFRQNEKENILKND